MDATKKDYHRLPVYAYIYIGKKSGYGETQENTPGYNLYL